MTREDAEDYIKTWCPYSQVNAIIAALLQGRSKRMKISKRSHKTLIDLDEKKIFQKLVNMNRTTLASILSTLIYILKESDDNTLKTKSTMIMVLKMNDMWEDDDAASI